MLSARPSVTRTSRHDPRGAALESVAAEFALLAQRRARIARQLDLLGRQLEAAQSSLDAVQGRMAMLAHRMDGIDPSLRPASIVAPPLVQPIAVRTASYQPAPPYQPPHTEAGPVRPFAAKLPRPLRQATRRRPFLPE
jgi:hypothetical protein